jgi:hypothetical protein
MTLSLCMRALHWRFADWALRRSLRSRADRITHARWADEYRFDTRPPRRRRQWFERAFPEWSAD